MAHAGHFLLLPLLKLVTISQQMFYINYLNNNLLIVAVLGQVMVATVVKCGEPFNVLRQTILCLKLITTILQARDSLVNAYSMLLKARFKLLLGGKFKILTPINLKLLLI